MEKSPIFLGAVGNVGGQVGVSLALNAEHGRQRRALGYLFTNSALLQHEKILQQHIQTFIEVLKRMTTERRSIDVSDWCEGLLCQFVCRNLADAENSYIPRF